MCSTANLDILFRGYYVNTRTKCAILIVEVLCEMCLAIGGDSDLQCVHVKEFSWWRAAHCQTLALKCSGCLREVS